MQSVNANSFHLHKAKIMSQSLALPDHFQVVVLGTGLTESVVAAAASRLGHTVLHIDTQDYYGGDWASFTLQGLTDWADSKTQPKSTEKSETKSSEESSDQHNTEKLLGEGEELYDLGDFSSVHSVLYQWHQNQENQQVKETETSASEKNDTNKASTENTDDIAQDDTKKTEEGTKHGSKKKQWNKELLLEENRRFNLDLSPRLLYARGAMVELLISSNISRYTEFKSVSRVLTQIGGRLEHVPSSRSDVFATKHITVVEKRILMKFLSFCVNEKTEDILEGKQHKTFKEFLAGENLTENLIHFVVHSIAMVNPTAGIKEGLEQTVKFLSSLGRFGSTPFLWSMYGTGELPQAFCRLCAVFGGVYYLGRNMSNLIVKDGKCVGVITEGKRINCDYLVIPDNRTPQNILKGGEAQVTTRRGIYVTESSVLPADKEQITLLSLPFKEPVHVMEVGPGTAACPKGLQIVHATSVDIANDDDGNKHDSLDKVDEIIPKDSLLFSLSFRQTTRTGDVSTKLSNVYRASGPRPELDFDLALQEAELIYKQLYPEDEFLPRAPDPEEIIIGGDESEEKVPETSNETSEKMDDTSNELSNTVKENQESMEVQGQEEANIQKKVINENNIEN